MKLNVYSVFDVKSKIYGRPFFMVNDPTAVRSLTDAANDVSTEIGKHPEDYFCYRIGFWNDDDALFTFDEVPTLLCKCIELVRS